MSSDSLVEIQNKKVSFHTLGCRLNFSETGSIAQGFADRGYEIVAFGEEADVTLLNTCTVTDGADSSCRNLIRKAHKASPEGQVVVVGCYAQMAADEISKMQGVDLILGTSEKYKVLDYLDQEERALINIDKAVDFYGAATTAVDYHTRAFLKIQDGCNYVCSFCIIPQARGRSRAISIANAVKEAETLIGSGFKEIVLTGVNIGEFEQSSGEGLACLAKKLLDLDGLERLRLSSVEPNTITDELLDVLASSPKFLDHFHIPLQSGADEVLTSMKRKYTVQKYKEVIEKIINKFPNAGIGADSIAGHPGETEEHFNKTLELLKELPITHFHVFPYSKRKGTIAVKMDNHIHSATKKERVKKLNELGEKKLLQFTAEQVGTTTKVLFERKSEDGIWEGYSTNYVRVFVRSDQDLKNQIRDIYLEKIDQRDKLIGQLLN